MIPSHPCPTFWNACLAKDILNLRPDKYSMPLRRSSSRMAWTWALLYLRAWTSSATVSWTQRIYLIQGLSESTGARLLRQQARTSQVSLAIVGNFSFPMLNRAFCRFFRHDPSNIRFHTLPASSLWSVQQVFPFRDRRSFFLPSVESIRHRGPTVGSRGAKRLSCRWDFCLLRSHDKHLLPSDLSVTTRTKIERRLPLNVRRG